MSEPRPERVDDERFVKVVRDVLEDDPDLTPRQAMDRAKRLLEHDSNHASYKTGGFK